MKNKRWIVFILVAGMLSGCTLGPDYKRPAIDTPEHWRVSEQQANDLAGTEWWRQFKDPVLNNLIVSALKNNKDLLIATARIEEYAGKFGIARSGLFPQVGAGAEYTRQRVTELGDNKLASTYKPTTGTFSATLNAAWELDFWGRVRRSTEAAKAQLVASEEGRRAVIVSLVSQVANAYINLRSLDRQLEITQETAASRGHSYHIFQERFTGGLISELELSQNRSQYEEALANIPLLEKAIAQQENGLNVLLGRNPGPIARGKTIDQLIAPTIAAGVPSDLLERRPDIREAEQTLIAANAQIGVAKAAYFPSITLTSYWGSASGDLSDLFKGPAKIWQFDAPVTVPIFTAGRIAGDVKATKAIQQQALLNYRQTIQNAFREVDDALINQQQTQKQLSVQKKQVNSLTQYADIARLRYENGYTDYLSVLDAERSLFNARLSYTQTEATFYQSVITFYKAMGGGWVNRADQMTRQVTPKL